MGNGGFVEVLQRSKGIGEALDLARWRSVRVAVVGGDVRPIPLDQLGHGKVCRLRGESAPIGFPLRGGVGRR